MTREVLDEIKELTYKLNSASELYYNGNDSKMSDREWDNLYNRLKHLEEITGITLANSPTTHVGYKVSSKWEKVTHEFPALSLDKTKDRDKLKSWLKNQIGVLSWKLDGLTVVLTYDNGKLTSLATRGNGVEGELITENAKYIYGVPLTIPYNGHLVVRGEAMISYDTFNEINSKIKNDEEKYKTPRNLASGSIRNFDGKVVSERKIEVKIFELVYSTKQFDYFYEMFTFLHENGFDIVDYMLVSEDTILDEVKRFEDKIMNNKFPSDGLVLTYNDIRYRNSLGYTSKFPLHSIAFKWSDDTYETNVTGIEWSPSRTGTLNPVLLFDTVNIDGADISRASIHNVSIMKSLKLGVGDKIEVYLANKIIPQVAINHTKSNTFNIPEICPECGSATEMRENKEGDTVVLVCTNQNCPAKTLGNLELFVSKDGMNIDGLSKNTLRLLYDNNYIKNPIDLYSLKDYKKELVKLDGMGTRSVTKLLKSIEESKNTTLDKYIRSLGIDLIGRSASKELAKFCNDDVKVFMQHINDQTDFSKCIDGFGEKMNQSIYNWFLNCVNMGFALTLIHKLNFKEKEFSINKDLKGQTFVITGSLNHYASREMLKEKLEQMGAKVSGSVSSKTTALINNDINSTSSKNTKAKQLNVPIWSEEELIDYLKE